MAKVKVMEHPLIRHKIGILRNEETSSKEFRELIGEVAMLMCFEATRELKLVKKTIRTPICETEVEAGGQEAGGGSHSPGRPGHGGRYAGHDSGG